MKITLVLVFQTAIDFPPLTELVFVVRGIKKTKCSSNLYWQSSFVDVENGLNITKLGTGQSEPSAGVSMPPSSCWASLTP